MNASVWSRDIYRAFSYCT